MQKNEISLREGHGLKKRDARIAKIHYRFEYTEEKDTLYSKRVLLGDIMEHDDYNNFTIVCITDKCVKKASSDPEFKFPKNLVHLILDDFNKTNQELLVLFINSDTPNFTTITVEKYSRVRDERHFQHHLMCEEPSKLRLPASIKTVITHDISFYGLRRILIKKFLSTIAIGKEYGGERKFPADIRNKVIYAKDDLQGFKQLKFVDPL